MARNPCIPWSCISLLSLLILGVRCEKSVGVSRTAELLSFPDPGCVREVIASNDAIVEYHEWFWPKPDSDPAAVARTQRSHSFAYSGKTVTVQLGIFEDEPNRIRWVQTDIRMDTPMSQQEVDEARRLMQAVELGVAEGCAQPALARVREACSGVKCQ